MQAFDVRMGCEDGMRGWDAGLWCSWRGMKEVLCGVSVPSTSLLPEEGHGAQRAVPGRDAGAQLAWSILAPPRLPRLCRSEDGNCVRAKPGPPSGDSS